MRQSARRADPWRLGASGAGLLTCCKLNGGTNREDESDLALTHKGSSDSFPRRREFATGAPRLKCALDGDAVCDHSAPNVEMSSRCGSYALLHAEGKDVQMSTMHNAHTYQRNGMIIGI